MENVKKQMFLLLSKNKESVLFLRPYKPDLSKLLLTRLKKSTYAGDTKFFELINKDTAANENFEDSEEVPTVIKRVSEPSNISTTLLQTWRPFMSVQADGAEFKFTKPSATDPSYVLTCVDLFTQRYSRTVTSRKICYRTRWKSFSKRYKKNEIFLQKTTNNTKATQR